MASTIRYAVRQRAILVMEMGSTFGPWMPTIGPNATEGRGRQSSTCHVGIAEIADLGRSANPVPVPMRGQSRIAAVSGR